MRAHARERDANEIDVDVNKNFFFIYLDIKHLCAFFFLTNVTSAIVKGVLEIGL